MAFKLATPPLDLTSILFKYLYPHKKSYSPAVELLRPHSETAPRRLTIPSSLYYALEEARYHISNTPPPESRLSWHSSVVVSTLVSAILNIGFENLFSGTLFLSSAQEILKTREHLFTLDDSLPQYAFETSVELAKVNFPHFPSETYSRNHTIQPRLPKDIVARTADEASHYETSTDKLISFCLLKALDKQPYIRNTHASYIDRCLCEGEKLLQQRSMYLQHLLQCNMNFAASWAEVGHKSS